MGDRLKTEEEIAAERERRAEAERALQRKRAVADGEEEDEGLPDQASAGAPAGGFAARRRRAQLELQHQQKRARLHGPSGTAQPRCWCLRVVIGGFICALVGG